MKSPVQLASNSTSFGVVSWSRDNRIAVATEKNIYILTLGCSNSLRDDFLILSADIVESERWKHRDFDVCINQSYIESLEMTSFVQQRFKLNKLLDSQPDEAQSSGRGFSSLRFSPLCTDQGGCMLACLTQDNRLRVCFFQDRGRHIQKVDDLSDELYQYARQRAFNLSSSQPSPEPAAHTSDFIESQKRLFSLATTKMEWSDVFESPETVQHSENSVPAAKRQCLQPGWIAERFVLLAAAMKSHHIVVWKVGCPDQKISASVGGVIETGSGFATCLHWHHLKDSMCRTAFLATGTCEGLIAVWRVCVEGEGLAVCKMVDACTDRDEVPVQALTWVNKLCAENSYVFVASKGFCIVVYQLHVKEGNMTVVHQSHKASLHSAIISDIVCHETNIYTSSADGGIQKTSIVKEEQGFSLSQSALEPSSHLSSIVDGVAMSPNGIYLAVVRRHVSFARRKTKTQLHFLTLSCSQEVEKVLLDPTGKLCHKFDCLDWLYQQLNTDSAVQTPLIEAILGERSPHPDEGQGGLGSGAWYWLKLQRLVLLMMAHKTSQKLDETDTYKKEKTEYEKSLKLLEEKTESLSRQLITLHAATCLTKLEEQADMKIQKEKGGRTGTVSKLMSDWLKKQDVKYKQQVTQPDSPCAARAAEACRLCAEDIALTSAVKDACSKGHCWNRCSLTLLLCQTMKPRRCVYCGMRYASAESTDTDWLVEVLQSDCLFCDGPLSNS